jgi:hypothetical protein
MSPVRWRAAVSRAVLGLVGIVLSIVSGGPSVGGGEPPRHRPNAVLIVGSIRDLRRPATARIAELLDTNPGALYLYGVRVHVDVRPDGINLIDRHGSAIDTLVRVPGERHRVTSGRWADAGPTLGLFVKSGQGAARSDG